MQASDVQVIYAPGLEDALRDYVCCYTSDERKLVWPSLSRMLNTDIILEPILIYYITLYIRNITQTEKINLSLIFTDIHKIINVVYPDRNEYSRQLTKQLIVVASKP